MRVAKLRIEGFRGIRNGEFVLHQKTAIVGSNGCGKSTIVDALSLVLGKSRMVRNLTEHDVTGSCPTPGDRFTIVAAIADFSSEDPSEHPDWFRMVRAIPKWSDTEGKRHSSSAKDRRPAGELAFAARFDHTDLTVETVRDFTMMTTSRIRSLTRSCSLRYRLDFLESAVISYYPLAGRGRA